MRIRTGEVHGTQKLYLELPLKADGSKTVKFDGDFRPRPNIPIFMKLWCD